MMSFRILSLVIAMASLSLKSKLGGIFGALTIIAGIQGGVSIFELSGIRHGVKEISGNWLPSVASVNQIRAEVDQVQAVAAIGSITTRIREINSVAASIAAAVEEQGAATQEIVRNVAQASTGTTEVTLNITGVARASEETGAAASQVLSAASELSRQSEHLSAEVQRFSATVRTA